MEVMYNVKHNKGIPKIYTEDLDFLAMQLRALVDIYRDNIYVTSDKQATALNELDKYATMLQNHMYGQLIMHADEIITSEPAEVELPWRDDVDKCV